MNITGITGLLRKINVLVKQVKERQQNNESFNIISVLRKPHDERYLHSRLIASLIDPKAPHGHNTLFLKSFLNVLGSSFEFNEKTLEICPSYRNCSEEDNIDILINDTTTGRVLIIENKIYAPDQPGQLIRYFIEMANKFGYIQNLDEAWKNIEIFYLTPHGRMPDKCSYSLENEQYKKYIPEYISNEKYQEIQKEINDHVHPVTYSGTIINWLDDCLKNIKNNNWIKEIIMQYLNIIEELTDQKSTYQEREELRKIIGESNDNLDSAKFLLKNQIHVYWYLLYYFWKDLTDKLNKAGYEICKNIEDSEITDFIYKGKEDFCLEFNPKDNKTKVLKIRCRHDQVLDYSVGGDVYKEFAIGEDGLRLSNFTSDETFSLLSEEDRNKIISMIIETIKDDISYL